MYLRMRPKAGHNTLSAGLKPKHETYFSFSVQAMCGSTGVFNKKFSVRFCSHWKRKDTAIMQTRYNVIKFFLVLYLPSASLFNCTETRRNQTDGNFSVIQENTYVNFIHPLTMTAHEESRNFTSRVINIMVCDNGTQSIVCKCRWGFDNHTMCKNKSDFSVCHANSSELRLSLLVRRTYTHVMWEIFEQNFTPHLLNYSELDVTYPPTIKSLLVNGDQVNETYFINDGKQPEVYCSYSNGNPPASLRLSDDRGQIHKVSNGEEDHVTITLSVVHCHDNWPVVRCEAGGSELSRSVSILVRCPPQFSNVTTETFDLSRIKDGLKINIRSHTGNISECWMRDLSLDKAPINCEISGSSPYFTLTLHFRTESWKTERNWTLLVGNEAGNSNMTFALRNSTMVETKKLSESESQEWVIALGSILGAVVVVAMAVLCVAKTIKTHNVGSSPCRVRSLQRSPGAHADNHEASQEDARDRDNEMMGHGVSARSFKIQPQTSPSRYRNA